MDVDDVLMPDAEKSETPAPQSSAEANKENAFPPAARNEAKKANSKKKKLMSEWATKGRPEGMSRELYAVLHSNNREAHPISFETFSFGRGYKEANAALGIKKVRPWEWVPFANSARTDGVKFHHWQRMSDEQEDHPSASFNKTVEIPSYSDADYELYLTVDGWTREETDHLIDLCRRFDLRFVVIQDRWDASRFSKRSIEDLKERYYNICFALTMAHSSTCCKQPAYPMYDADHERKRKQQLDRLLYRTDEQTEEEQILVDEMRTIGIRSKEREKTTKVIERMMEVVTVEKEKVTTVSRKEKKSSKKKVAIQKTTPLLVKAEPNTTQKKPAENVDSKISRLKIVGTSLKSYRMKNPMSFGQKKGKAIEQMVAEMGLDSNPLPSDDNIISFNELIDEMSVLYELKLVYANCEFELQKLKHQLEPPIPEVEKNIPIPESISSGAIVDEATAKI